MLHEAYLVIAAVGSLLLLVSCGPSQAELQARKAAEEKARVGMALKQIQEANRAPVLAPGDKVLEGEKGLRFVESRVGTGKEARDKGTVTVNFIGWVDGVKIDSSDDRGKPTAFVVGGGQVIEGWSVGVRGMKEGGIRLLIIPPGLAYGNEGRPGFVGRDKTLWYRLELLKAYDPF